MKVLWLGAGASRSAGYPVTASLLDELHRWVRASADVASKAAWKNFNEFRESGVGVVKTILQSPNPEVALTLPDLLEAARAAEGERLRAIARDATDKAREKRRRGEDPEGLIERARNRVKKRRATSELKLLDEAVRARQSFEVVLDNYLASRHRRDGHRSNSGRRDCLRRELAWVGRSGVVITTNWDTSVERTLLEDGLWTPADGYGFPVDLVYCSRAQRGETSDPPAWVPRESQIHVLKLHESFGWRWNARFGPRVTLQGEVFLEFDRFLARLPFRSGTRTVVARDCREPDALDEADLTLFVLPSYLKRLQGETMQLVWHKAAQALSSAKQLRFVGASLPPSDEAVRALLNSVRFRSEDGAIDLAVHNPDPTTHDRWRDFLGGRASVLPLRTGQRDGQADCT